MSGEKIILVGDSVLGPTGFATNSSSIAWMLSDEYDIHHLGLQSVNQQRIKLKFHGEEREITEHPNLPRGKQKWDFGHKSLPGLLDRLQPDILITVNDIQMIQHVPNTLYPQMVQMKLLDLPSRKMVSRDALIMELDGHIQRFKEKYPLDTRWLCYAPEDGVMGMPQWKSIYQVADKCVAFCTPPGTLIYTKTGTIPIENLEIGDLILTHDGDFKPVTNISEHYHNPSLIHIKPLYIPMGIKLTPNHRVLSIHKEDYSVNVNPQWINASNLRIGDYLTFPIIKDKDIKCLSIRDISGVFRGLKKNISDKVSINKDFMKLVGYYLSEGFCMTPGKRNINPRGIAFTLHINETEFVDEIKYLIRKIFGLKKSTITYFPESHGLSLQFYSTKLGKFFKDLLGTGAKNKYIPDWILKLPKNKLTALIETYWKGDGCISSDKRDNSIVFSANSASPSLIWGLFLIGLKLNTALSVRKGKQSQSTIRGRKIETRGDIYYLRSNRTNNILGKIFNHEPKSSRGLVQWDENYVYLPIRKINNIEYSGKVYNLEIQGDESYVTQAGIVHNSKFGKKVFKDSWNMDVPYIYHAIDTDLFAPQERTQFKNKFVIGNFNRNQPRKQPVRTIMGFAKFAKGKNDVLLHMQMDWNDQFGWPIQYFGQMYGCINKMIQPAPVGMPKEQVAKIYSQWDLSVNTTGGEGFGLCDIESMSTGTPQVSTAYTTPQELIIDGKPTPRGALIPYKELYWEKMDVAAVPRSAADIDELAKIFEMYYTNRELIEEHSENARIWVEKYCSMKKLQHKWKSLVKEVLNK